MGSIFPTAKGDGGRGAVLEGTAIVGEVAVTAWAGSCCLLVPKNAAVVAAPATADTPATAARVNLLMVDGAGEVSRDGGKEGYSRHLSPICRPCLSTTLEQHADRIICPGSFTCRQKCATNQRASWPPDSSPEGALTERPLGPFRLQDLHFHDIEINDHKVPCARSIHPVRHVVHTAHHK